MKKIIFTILTLLFLGSTNAAYAEVPDFPSCNAPQGSIISKYDDGVHGVPGDSTTYTGEDIVYKIDDDRVMQCFCADNGDGTQSNWFKISSLTSQVAKDLLNSGWIYIPTGLDWGLADSEFLVQNTKYDCGVSEGVGGEVKSDTENKDESKSSTHGVILAEAASTESSVLGLADTGNAQSILKLSAIGSILIAIGLLIRKNFN